MTIRLAIVDDHPMVTNGLVAALATIDDFVVVGRGSSVEQARELLVSDDLDVVLLDVRLEDGNGIQALPSVAFFAYATPRYGVDVGAGEIDGDGFAEIVTGPDPSRRTCPSSAGSTTTVARLPPHLGSTPSCSPVSGTDAT